MIPRNGKHLCIFVALICCVHSHCKEAAESVRDLRVFHSKYTAGEGPLAIMP